jgi:hypothetical protein
VKINTIKDFRAFLDQTNITVTDFAALADINRSQLLKLPRFGGQFSIRQRPLFG